MCDCVDKLSDSNLCAILPGTSSDTFCQGKTQQFYADPCDCTKYVQCSNHNTFLQSCGAGTMWSQSSLACVAGSCSAASPQTPASPLASSPSVMSPATSPPSSSPSPATSTSLPSSSPSPATSSGSCPTGIVEKSQKIAFMSSGPWQCCYHCLTAFVLCSCIC